MPNKIKYNSGNWLIGSHTGMGPSASTSFYNGLDIPENGYVIYSSGINARIANNDAELINYLNKLGAGLPNDDLAGCLEWARQNNVLVLNKFFKEVVADGLVLNVEPSHTASYFRNIPATNLLAANDPELNNTVTWTNSGDWTWTDNATDVDFPFQNGSNGLRIMKGQSITTGSQHWGLASFTGAASTTYTISVFFRQNRAGCSSPYFRTHVNNNWMAQFTYNGDGNSANWPVNEWIRISATATLQSNETGAYLSNYLGSQHGDAVWYAAPMVELGDTMSPFVNGVRNQNTNLVDLSNQSSNGILLGNPTQDAYGNLVLDGAGDHIQFNSHPAFNVNTRTIEIKFKMNSAYPDFSPLAVYAEGSSATDRIWLGIQNNKFQMHGWGTDDPTGSTTIEAGKWYTCAFSYDKASQQMKIYTNGKLERTITNSQAGVVGRSGMNWYIGAVPGSWYNVTYSDVTIGSFKVYNRILTDSEVASNYYNGNITTRNLVQHYDFGNELCYVDGSTVIRNLADTSSESAIVNTADAISYNKHLGYLEWTGNDNAYIDIPNTGNMATFSLSTWVWNDPTGVTSRHSILRDYWEIVETSIQFWSYDFDNDYWRSSGNGAVPYNQWTHITTTWDGFVIRHYINGILYWEDPNTSGGTSQSLNTFGGYGGRILDGRYATLSIYNDVLTQEEILDNYNVHAPRFR